MKKHCLLSQRQNQSRNLIPNQRQSQSQCQAQNLTLNLTLNQCLILSQRRNQNQKELLMRKRVKLDWRGEQTLRQVTNRATAALNEIDRTAERHAKAELYPGHGVRTGALRRSIASIPAVTRGRRIIGGIGTTKGDVSAYARVIHRKYEYLTKGLQKTIPSVIEIIERHMRK